MAGLIAFLIVAILLAMPILAFLLGRQMPKLRSGLRRWEAYAASKLGLRTPENFRSQLKHLGRTLVFLGATTHLLPRLLSTRRIVWQVMWGLSLVTVTIATNLLLVPGETVFLIATVSVALNLLAVILLGPEMALLPVSWLCLLFSGLLPFWLLMSAMADLGVLRSIECLLSYLRAQLGKINDFTDWLASHDLDPSTEEAAKALEKVGIAGLSRADRQEFQRKVRELPRSILRKRAIQTFFKNWTVRFGVCLIGGSIALLALELSVNGSFTVQTSDHGWPIYFWSAFEELTIIGKDYLLPQTNLAVTLIGSLNLCGLIILVGGLSVLYATYLVPRFDDVGEQFGIVLERLSETFLTAVSRFLLRNAQSVGRNPENRRNESQLALDLRREE